MRGKIQKINVIDRQALEEKRPKIQEGSVTLVQTLHPRFV